MVESTVLLNGEKYIISDDAASRLGVRKETVMKIKSVKFIYHKRRKYARESDIKELEERKQVKKPEWLYDDYCAL